MNKMIIDYHKAITKVMDHKIKINIIIIIIRLRIMVEVHEVEEKDFKKRVKTINFLKILIKKQIIRNLKVLALVEEVKEIFRTRIPIKIKIKIKKIIIKLRIKVEVLEVEEEDFQKRVKTINFA